MERPHVHRVAAGPPGGQTARRAGARSGDLIPLRPRGSNPALPLPGWRAGGPGRHRCPPAGSHRVGGGHRRRSRDGARAARQREIDRGQADATFGRERLATVRESDLAVAAVGRIAGLPWLDASHPALAWHGCRWPGALRPQSHRGEGRRPRRPEGAGPVRINMARAGLAGPRTVAASARRPRCPWLRHAKRRRRPHHLMM